MLRAIVVVVSIVVASISAFGGEPATDDDEINPALLRRFWLGAKGPQPVSTPYELTDGERQKFRGTFGLDLSHYTFDIKNDNPKCKTAPGYNDPECSCSIDWNRVRSHGVHFVYSKASDGDGVDRSFSRVWTQLESQHLSGKIFRGAYHFLRPDISVQLQAETFLRAIGAVDGRRPKQLHPVLDIEWSNKLLERGTDDFAQCPVARRIQNDKGNYYCDMWHTKKPAEIASLAKRWIDLVEAATGKSVIIYTNPAGWWNQVMTADENYVLAGRAVWTSRYTRDGPTYNDAWNSLGGSAKWKMAPLPRGASFPDQNYSVPHMWQFTESGSLPSPVLSCAGRAQRRYMDMNFVPVPLSSLVQLFGLEK